MHEGPLFQSGSIRPFRRAGSDHCTESVLQLQLTQAGHYST